MVMANCTKIFSNKSTKNQTPAQKFNNLPHVDMIGYYQFVTFRTFDSIDDFFKKTQ